MALAIAASLCAWPASAIAADLTGPRVVGPGQRLLLSPGDSFSYEGPDVALTVRGAKAVVSGQHATFQFGGGLKSIASGLHAVDGGRLELDRGSIDSSQPGKRVYDTVLVQGKDAAGVASKMSLSSVDIEAGYNENGQGALIARDGGKLYLTDGRISGGDGQAFFGLFTVSGAGTQLGAVRTSVSLSGNSGLSVYDQGSLTLNDMRIDTTAGYFNLLVSDSGSRIDTANLVLHNGRYDIDAGAEAEIRNGTVSNELQSIFHVLGGASASRVNVEFGTYSATGSYVAELDHDAIFTAKEARFEGVDVLAALYTGSNSAELALKKSTIHTAGKDGGHGVDVYGGTAKLDSVDLSTSGNAAYALRGTQGSETLQSRLRVRDSQVQVNGSGGGALYVEGDKVSALIERSTLTAGNATAHGLVHVDHAQLRLEETNVTVTGEHASAYLSQVDMGKGGNSALFVNSNLLARSGPALDFQGDQHKLTLQQTRILSGEGEAKPAWLMRVSDFKKDATSATATAGEVIIAATNSELFGNVRVDSASANVKLYLQGSSLLQGALLDNAGSHVAEMRLRDASFWVISGHSILKELSHQGEVRFASPSDASDFKHLSVVNHYYSDGGTLVFNTRLEGDNSATDTLHVRGKAEGSGNVSVVNANGQGGLTREGIRLVRVDGPSEATLTLAGRVVAGPYEYLLVQGSPSEPDDGDWYLRSSGPPPKPDDPIKPDDPVKPDNPIEPIKPIRPVDPLLRPEVAAYRANQWAAINLFSHTLHERLGEPLFADRQHDDHASQVWLRTQRRQMDTRSPDRQLASSIDSTLVQAGTELTRWEHGDHRWHLGAMAGVAQAQSHVGSHLTGYRAKGSVRGQSVGVYGSWFARASEGTGLYLDSWVQRAWFDQRVMGQGLPQVRYSARSWTASLEAGYAWNWLTTARARWLLEPQLQYVYVQHSAEHVREANGSRIDASAGTGSDRRVGVRLYAQVRDRQVMRVQPYLGLHREFFSARRGVSFDGVALNHGMPRRADTVQVGADAEVGGGWTARGFISLRHGRGQYREVSGQIGLGYRW